MLARLRLEDIAVNTVQLLQKDSLDLTDHDRGRIVDMVRVLAGKGAGDVDGDGDTDGVVVLHGTDTLCVTGKRLHEDLSRSLKIPVILTGAMRPWEMKRSDALQNLNESVFAAGVLKPGVWCVAHGRAIPFPHVRKDRERGTFVVDEAGQADES